MSERIVSIARDHPSLAGHFPGNPVVPGVVVLQQVMDAIEDRYGPFQLLGLPWVKFLRPVRPGAAMAIALGAPAGDRLDFVCRCGTETVAKGQVRIDVRLAATQALQPT
jgi:3-hydroxymyristoyl/3-hydroxydecanoyl-(acyl carrier protein) dehydratase